MMNDEREKRTTSSFIIHTSYFILHQQVVHNRMKIPVKHRAIILPLLFISALNLSFTSQARQPSGPVKSVVTFEEVLPKASGITWVHNNAHSPERFLPE